MTDEENDHIPDFTALTVSRKYKQGDKHYCEVQGP